MNLGIGIDLIGIDRMRSRLLRRPGLAERLFTARERATAEARLEPAEFYAGRFAAKEAAFKALGSGWPECSWSDVEVLPGPAGSPQLRFVGRAAALLADRGAAVSIAHSDGIAVANVIIS